MTTCNKSKQCKYYSKYSDTCSYYGGGDYCGKYRKMEEKGTHKPILTTIILSLILILLFISPVLGGEIEIPSTPIQDESGLSWDNIIQTNEDLKIDKVIESSADLYPAITIYNNFDLPFFGSKLMDAVLEKHTGTCGQDCSSEFEVTTYQDSPLLTGVKFETIKEDGKRVEQDVRSYGFYLRTKHEPYTANDYELVCVGTGVYELNGTEIKDCSNEVSGNHTEYKDAWIPYNYEVMPTGTYTLKLDGEKRPDRTVDWIITSQGKEIGEWSSWVGDSYTTDKHNLLQPSTTNDAAYRGVKIYVKNNVTLINVTVAVGVAHNEIRLLNSTLSILASSDISGGIANFSYNLTKGLEYYVVAGCGGASCASRGNTSVTFPVAGTDVNLNWTGGLNGATIDNSSLINIANITTLYYGSIVTLNSPADNYVSNTSTVSFNGTVSVVGGATASQVMFWDNSTGVWAINQTYTYGASGIVSQYLMNAQAFVTANQFNVTDDESINNGTLSGKTFNDGTPTNGAFINTTNNALGFDGVNDGIEIPTNLTNPLTISMWFNTANAGQVNQFMMRNAGDGAGNLFYFSIAGNNLGCGWRFDNDSVDRRFSGSILGLYSSETWHYATCVIDSDNGIGLAYLDDTLIVNSTTTYTLGADLSSTLYISSTTNPNQAWNGSLDDVEIYNRALSPTEITAQYNLGRGKYADNGEGLIAQYSGRDYAGTEAVPTTIFDTNHLVNGKINEAISFDGVDDFVTIPSSSSFDFGESVTLSAWIKPDDAGTGYFMSKDDSGANRDFYFNTDGNTLRFISFGLVDTSMTVGTGVTLKDRWSYVLFTYNGTAKMIYVDGVQKGIEYTTGTLAHSAEDLYIGKRITFFNGSIDDVRIYNRSLSQAEITYIYNSGDGREDNDMLTSQEAIFSNTYTDGTYLWGMSAMDSDGEEGYSVNRTITIDTTYPTIDISYPNGTITYGYVGQNISLNYSITDDGTVDTCWYEYNGTNTTVSCDSNSSVILTTQENITLWANDTAGNVMSSFSNWTYIYFGAGQSYNNQTYETSTENFYTNVTYNSSAYEIIIKLNYDGINHTAINIGSGDNGYFNATIQIPLINTSANKTFFWFVNNTAGDSFNQTVNPIILQICNATYNISALNFTYYDESNLLPINATTNNTIMKATYGFWIGDGTVKKEYSYQNLTATTNSFAFCISPPQLNMTIDLALEYGAVGYLENSYELQSNAITNVTRNITLYLLPITLGTKFTHTLRRGIDFVPNTLVGIEKYFVGVGLWKSIGIRKTDTTGRFVQYLELDKRYNYTVQNDNGSIVASIENTAICLTAPCEITLQIDKASTTVFDEINAYIAQNVLYTLIYNKTIKTVNLTFDDLTGTAQYWRLWVYKPYFNNETLDTICNTTSYTVAGSMTCNTTGYYGDIVAKVYISRSPEFFVDFLTFLNEDRTEALGTSGLLASILILLVIIFTASRSATGALIMIPFGLIILKFIGFLPLSWGVVVGVVVLITIIAMKMKT